MAEDFTITFQGIDEISTVIDEIKEKLDDLSEEGEKDPEGEDVPEIIITSDQIEPEVEQIMWDVIDRIKVRATEEEAEFLLNI